MYKRQDLNRAYFVVGASVAALIGWHSWFLRSCGARRDESDVYKRQLLQDASDADEKEHDGEKRNAMGQRTAMEVRARNMKFIARQEEGAEHEGRKKRKKGDGPQEPLVPRPFR